MREKREREKGGGVKGAGGVVEEKETETERDSEKGRRERKK